MNKWIHWCWIIVKVIFVMMMYLLALLNDSVSKALVFLGARHYGCVWCMPVNQKSGCYKECSCAESF